ncbi:YheU family protein [Endozoicomonas gorgoniicola]|uniref:YheU family protein n=1 Tax=Endozoicomonas gorgoniicola TaxID=1234144 RepID=A0ABT3MXN3_9GAMM|nr:YheU family protein [Endozoicomonas gorgoniicola]MCW7554151.1 YheU family protein [Endozoicomonas gorgoniicola]
MIIPYKDIEPDTLNNLIEEFVTRDGTDNGYDQPLEQKIESVLKQLQQGEVVVVFDPNLASVNIVPRNMVAAMDGSH